MLAAGVPIDLDRVSGVALTHLHADHCTGLEDYGFYWYYILGQRARLRHVQTLRSPKSSGTAR